jgi:hypothetical protein
MGREQNWQRDIRIEDEIRARQEQSPQQTAPQPPLDLEAFIAVFLDQHQHEYVDGIAAGKELEKHAIVRAAALGRGFTASDRFRLSIATVAAFNRRANAAEEDRRARSEWIADFQAGAR